MANFYGKDREKDFAASKLMSFGKSFSRMNGQPLDESEVWYDKAALEAYAAGNSAYVGMKLVYVDEANQKVYQYSVQYDGSIKEIGTSPIGDDKSIVVDAETGTVSLKGVDGLNFSREGDDILDGEGNPTGEKTIEEIKYQPLMTKDGLVWVEPSKTTVEGLATEIGSIKTDMAAQATKIDALQEVVYGTLAEDGETRNEDGLDDRISAVESAVGAPAVEGDEPVAASGLYAELDKKADSDYVDKTFLKGQTFADAIKNYSTTEQMNAAIGNAIGEAGHLKRLIVTELPTENIDPNTVYMIKRDDATVTTEGTVQDVYDEYLYIVAEEGVPGTWEKIGNTIVDLSNYYTKDEADEAFISPEELTDELNARVFIIPVVNGEYTDSVDTGGSSTVEKYYLTAAKEAVVALNEAYSNDNKPVIIYFNYGNKLYLAEIPNAKSNQRAILTAHIPSASWTEAVDEETVTYVYHPAQFTLTVQMSDAGTNVRSATGKFTHWYTQDIATASEYYLYNAPSVQAVKDYVEATKSTVDENKVDYTNLNTSEFNVDDENNISIKEIEAEKVVGLVDNYTKYEDFNVEEFKITEIVDETTQEVTGHTIDILKISQDKVDGLSDEFAKYQPVGNYKVEQTAVDNKITDVAHVLTSLTQNTNGEIAYEVKKLTPENIGAQPAGNYVTEDTFNTFVNTEAKANSGIRFINQDEIDKLTKLVLENGEIGISGTINAANVKELDTAVVDIVTRQQSTDAEGNIIKGLGIETGAQVNKIESISVDGLALSITDKNVDIPAATTNALGVVRSTDKENFVYVHESDVLDDETVTIHKGTMEIKSLNVNRLVQTAGERLILNGGNASLN